jgi:hypothetical protein
MEVSEHCGATKGRVRLARPALANEYGGAPAPCEQSRQQCAYAVDVGCLLRGGLFEESIQLERC